MGLIRELGAEDFAFGAAVGAIVILIAALVFRYWEKSVLLNEWQSEAVRAGAAHYASDENGKPKFEYIVPTERIVPAEKK